MFDIGFTELLVIGVVALIVIGPERMPKVARTVGHLVGRMQRYATSIKADINREVQFDEIRRAGEDFRNSMTQAKSELDGVAHTMEDEVAGATKVAEDAGIKPATQRVMDALQMKDPALADTPVARAESAEAPVEAPTDGAAPVAPPNPPATA
jgi:sec-independent protein translocase protein TatB